VVALNENENRRWERGGGRRMGTKHEGGERGGRGKQQKGEHGKRAGIGKKRVWTKRRRASEKQGLRGMRRGRG
jgi:hypothetical protein